MVLKIKFRWRIEDVQIKTNPGYQYCLKVEEPAKKTDKKQPGRKKENKENVVLEMTTQ